MGVVIAARGHHTLRIGRADILLRVYFFRFLFLLIPVEFSILSLNRNADCLVPFPPTLDAHPNLDVSGPRLVKASCDGGRCTVISTYSRHLDSQQLAVMDTCAFSLCLLLLQSSWN